MVGFGNTMPRQAVRLRPGGGGLSALDQQKLVWGGALAAACCIFALHTFGGKASTFTRSVAPQIGQQGFEGGCSVITSDVAVPELLLDGHQVSPSFQQMGRVAVPQGVHRCLFADARCRFGAIENGLCCPDTQRPAGRAALKQEF